MLIHPWDEATRDEWQDLLRHHDFGQLVVSGQDDDFPTVVPTHFVHHGDDQIWFHLARPNPVWRAIESNPRVVLSVIADYTYIEAAWNADIGVPAEHGVPTSYYSAVQLRGTAEVVDDPGEKLEVLTAQLAHFEPAGSTRVSPSAGIESDRRLLPGIRAVKLHVESVLAKMKYGGNKPLGQRQAIADQLAHRAASMDRAARAHVLRRSNVPD